MSHKTWLKKLGYKEIVINMGMFDNDIIAVIGDNKNLQEYIRFKYECDNDIEVSNGYGYCFYCEGYLPIIWIPKYPRTPKEYGTLAHECFHAAMHLSRWANIKVDENSEEVVAHATGFLVKSILESKKGV